MSLAKIHAPLYIRLDIRKAHAMNMQVGRWGNSLAVRFPKELVKRFGIKEGKIFSMKRFEKLLEEECADERQKVREQALAEIAAAGWTLPADWKFDREEANER